MPRLRTLGVGGSRASARRAVSGDEEVLRWCREVVSRVGVLDAEMSARSNDDLLGMTGSFRARLARGEQLDALLPEAFAAAREAASRTLGQRPFDVQVMGAAVLHRGLVAEMRTGKGKTLTGALAAYLNALPGAGVHVLTANDYLAGRDREWMAPVFGFLGMETGLLGAAYQFLAETDSRLAAYAADVTYGPWAEFGYDYLRDNMAWSPGECVQRGLGYAIVDEADLILVDEMRSPLLISGPGDRRAIDSGHREVTPHAALALGTMLKFNGDIAGARAAYRLAIDTGYADIKQEATRRLRALSEAPARDHKTRAKDRANAKRAQKRHKKK
jgi:preprotein translocase subunit SecA